MRKSFGNNIGKNILIGLLVVGPIYLTVLLLLKAASTVAFFLHPLMVVLPAPEHFRIVLAAAILLVVLYWVGVMVKTRWGNYYRNRFEHQVLEKVPGYSILRGFLRRLTGQVVDDSWQPALIETDDQALMPAFVIEQTADGRYSVFVPSVPTPFAGAVFIYQPERVHFVDISFAKAVSLITHWGQGASEWVAAMRKPGEPVIEKSE